MDEEIEKPDKSYSRKDPITWFKENDVIVLIFVGIITVACTRVASHIESTHIHPHLSHLTGQTTDINHINSVEVKKSNPWTQTLKVLIEFIILLLIIYFIVEFIIRPKAPFSLYMMPDSVSQKKQEIDSINKTNEDNIEKWENSFESNAKSHYYHLNY